MPSFCSLLISSVLDLGLNDSTFFKTSSQQRVFKERLFLGFSVRSVRFSLLVKKGFLSVILPIFDI